MARQSRESGAAGLHPSTSSFPGTSLLKKAAKGGGNVVREVHNFASLSSAAVRSMSVVLSPGTAMLNGVPGQRYMGSGSNTRHPFSTIQTTNLRHPSRSPIIAEDTLNSGVHAQSHSTPKLSSSNLIASVSYLRARRGKDPPPPSSSSTLTVPKTEDWELVTGYF